MACLRWKSVTALDFIALILGFFCKELACHTLPPSRSGKYHQDQNQPKSTNMEQNSVSQAIQHQYFPTKTTKTSTKPRNMAKLSSLIKGLFTKFPAELRDLILPQIIDFQNLEDLTQAYTTSPRNFANNNQPFFALNGKYMSEASEQYGKLLTATSSLALEYQSIWTDQIDRAYDGWYETLKRYVERFLKERYGWGIVRGG